MKRQGSNSFYGNAYKLLNYSTNGEAGDWYVHRNILNIDVELGNENKLSEKFYPPIKL